MKTNFIISLLYLLYFAALQVHGRQDDALTTLFNAKFKQKSEIDTNSYKEIRVIDETRVVPQEGLKKNDKIEKLPGQPNVKFSQYGGYVNVDEKAGRALYYYFAEADHLKQSKPLLLWLNGGPGCSSVGYGAMQEIGPFRVHRDGKTLFQNPYAWNKVANVLFLESPAGVGFSYSNTTSDYNPSGDQMTAQDNYVFLVNWLKRFPEYKDRNFYIAGESYAGHYVPQLAHIIQHHNTIANNKTIVNLKGIMIGNAAINDETDAYGVYDYFWARSFLSDESIYSIHKYCDFSPNATTTSQPMQCEKARAEAERNVGPVNVFNVYAPSCASNEPETTSAALKNACSGEYVYNYLNTPEVQKALHANITSHLRYKWESCSDILQNWGDSPSTVLPLLQELMDMGIRVWVFSGDADGMVPVTSTRYSLNKLKLPIKTTLYPWIVQGEVGGYTMVYKGDLTFATVRGAGHQVPSYQPIRALALIRHFLQGKPLPPN
ncbi:hypothetical protein ACHQM5_024390 [Ranunculus cassubicifolius]